MIDEGHEIGNHSVTHPSEGLPSQSLEQQKNEVMENHQYMKDNFGYDMHLFRFPAGKFSDRSLAVVNNCNYKSVFWMLCITRTMMSITSPASQKRYRN